MMSYEEKMERAALIDAVHDTKRLAAGLDQLLAAPAAPTSSTCSSPTRCRP